MNPDPLTPRTPVCYAHNNHYFFYRCKRWEEGRAMLVLTTHNAHHRSATAFAGNCVPTFLHHYT